MSAPRLSILIPFHNDDPSALVAALLAQAPRDIEICVLDDASTDTTVFETLKAQSALEPRLTALRAAGNLGRSGARNTLMAQSTARHILFLDADMMPGGDEFLGLWLHEVEHDTPVAFGGFIVPTSGPADTALHRSLSAASDCHSASEREARPAEATTTANLLVRRDVLEAVTFDGGFEGYGFEDTDWALRVSRQFDIRHIDNPAVHLGLDADERLLRKAAASARNFARLISRHEAQAQSWPNLRAARLLGRIPFARAARFAYAGIAKARFLPMRLRVFGFKLYRAAGFAEALKEMK
jgi:glycosyltransferase involved in cell wall biosynthesis